MMMMIILGEIDCNWERARLWAPLCSYSFSWLNIGRMGFIVWFRFDVHDQIIILSQFFSTFLFPDLVGKLCIPSVQRPARILLDFYVQ